MITLPSPRSEPPEKPQHLFSSSDSYSLTPWSSLSWNMKDHVLHIFYSIPIRCHYSNCLTFIGWFSSDRHNLSSDFLHFSMWIYHSKVSSQEVLHSVSYVIFLLSPCLVALTINFLIMKISQWSLDQVDEVLCHAEWLEGRASPRTLICRRKRAQFMVTFKQILIMKIVNQNKEHPLFSTDNKQRWSTMSIWVLPG